MANKYDEFFDFRFAEEADIKKIMRFIRENWQEDHILANDEGFFRYHFCDVRDPGKVNVFLMLEKNGDIAGMIGQVIYGEDGDGTVYFSDSMTMVRPDLSVPMCGVELQKRLPEYERRYTEFSCGTNPNTILPIYKNVLKYDTGTMDLYYIKNPTLRDFQLIKPGESAIEPKHCPGVELILRNNFETITLDLESKYELLPYKSPQFLKKRYFMHPIFDYIVYEILEEGVGKGVIVLREAEHDGSRLLFFVDYIGEIEYLGKAGKGLRDILVERQAECIHLMQHGVPKNVLTESGFTEVDIRTDEVVVPTYFEPYYFGNITNYYVKSAPEIILFKATGDQDNPKYRKKQEAKAVEEA